MKYQEGNLGRVFILRLEHNEIVHEVVENFAKDKNIKSAALIAVGGGNEGSKVVVGPENGNSKPVNPMEHILQNVHEIVGTGTLFPDESGNPMLHMHMAFGRESSTVTGCIRRGVKVWQILEIIIFEINGINVMRKYNKSFGFHLLEP